MMQKHRIYTPPRPRSQTRTPQIKGAICGVRVEEPTMRGNRYLDKLIDGRSDEVLSQEHLPVHQKLFGVVLAGRVQDGSRSELLGELHRPENEAFHVRSQQRALATMIPTMADITREGMREGLFSTRFPEEAVEMTLLYAFDELSVSELKDAGRKA